MLLSCNSAEDLSRFSAIGQFHFDNGPPQSGYDPEISMFWSILKVDLFN